MSDALDAFVVDGIEHNIPFLAALMQHPRWREGRLSTAFIAEEYPDGFEPILPTDEEKTILAAVALSVELLRKDRLDRLTGRLAPHSGVLKADWEVKIGDEYIPVSITEGIAFGFISFAMLKLLTWRAAETEWLIFLFAGLFLVRYIVLT